LNILKNYHYGIPKYELSEKVFGLFNHVADNWEHTLLRGFDDTFLTPHSRYTEIKRYDIEKVSDLEILASSEQAGINIVADKSGRQIFITGHFEYDRLTLNNEYIRDINRKLNIKLPENYYPNDNPNNNPVHKWCAHANLFFSNWLNYYVYQGTPYDLNTLYE